MNLRIQQFKTALIAFCKGCGVDMYHNESLKETGDYGIWYEMGERRLDANDRVSEKSPVISVQIWTKKEYSELPGKLEDFFDSYDAAWECQTYADYDSEVQRYHYGWTVELI